MKEFKIKKYKKDSWLDVVEVVRCKNCVYKRIPVSNAEGATGCILIQGTFYDDFYCAAGILNDSESD